MTGPGSLELNRSFRPWLHFTEITQKSLLKHWVRFAVWNLRETSKEFRKEKDLFFFSCILQLHISKQSGICNFMVSFLSSEKWSLKRSARNVASQANATGGTTCRTPPRPLQTALSLPFSPLQTLSLKWCLSLNFAVPSLWDSPTACSAEGCSLVLPYLSASRKILQKALCKSLLSPREEWVQA